MKNKIGFFIGFVCVCVIVAVGFVLITAQYNAASNPISNFNSNAPNTSSALALSLNQPALINLRKEFGPQTNHIQVMTLTASQPNTFTAPSPHALACERAYFASTAGICIARTFLNPLRAIVSITLLGPNLQPRFALQTEGIPTRARVSADGRYAAYTTFVTGHSYLDTRLSTRTEIIDLTTQQPLGNLENFLVYTNSQRLQASDFNYWGVTFAADSNTFYATLRTNGVNWLVRGHVQQRRVDLVRAGVECPSLSPDGTRIAFKKLNPDHSTWRLHVLRLDTLQEYPLAEANTVDDQAEWLDNSRVLYERVELSDTPRIHIWVANGDGSGTPSFYLADAGSPSVIR